MIDLIYLIILTPTTIVVMYGVHVLRRKPTKTTPEATPYKFERDEYRPGFNEAIQHQRNELKRLYRGEALRS